MNWKTLVAGALACFALGYFAGTAGKPSSDELDAARDSTHAAVARATEAEQAREAVEIGARAAIEQQSHAKDSALGVARAAQARQPTIIDRIVEREAPADTALYRRVASTVVDSLTVTQIRPLYAALAAADSVNRAQGALLGADRDARIAAQTALAASLRQNDLLLKARPSWFARDVLPLLKIAGAFGAGFEAGKHLPDALPLP